MEKKKILKIILILIITSFCMYQISIMLTAKPTYGASGSNSESDVQLIARAINRRS